MAFNRAVQYAFLTFLPRTVFNLFAIFNPLKWNLIFHLKQRKNKFRLSHYTAELFGWLI